MKNFPTKNDRIRGPPERSKRGTSRAPGAAAVPFRLLFLCWALRVALRRGRSTRTSTRSRDAGFFCVFRCLRFAIRTRDSTRTDTRRMDSLGTFMTPHILMMSFGIATPAAPTAGIVTLNSRRSSASPVYRIRHNSRLAHLRARGLGGRVMSILFLLVHLSLRAPRDRFDASGHSSRVSRSGARAWLE